MLVMFSEWCFRQREKNYPNFPKQKVLAIFDTVLSTSFFLPEFYLQNKPELSMIFLQDPPKQILPIESSWTLTRWSQRLCKFYTKRDLNQKHPEGPNSAKMLVGLLCNRASWNKLPNT